MSVIVTSKVGADTPNTSLEVGELIVINGAPSSAIGK